MGEDNQAINTDVPTKLWRQAKSQAALSGKTIKEWLIEAIEEKIGHEKS